MSREEEIKVSALKYIDNFIQDVCRICGNDDSIKGYIGLSQVWHNASEGPVKRGEILLIGELGNSWVCYVSSSLETQDGWEKYVKDELVTQWAYVNDLLPKGGEE